MPEIKLDANINELLKLPDCVDLKLPAPEKLKIQLPTGGSIQALTDISKGIPNDCSLTFNLMLQLGPLLSNLDCLVKILGFLKALTDVVPGPPTPKSIQKFAKATADLVPCFLIPTPAAMIPFVRDILCLILKVLKCLIGQIKTLMSIMGGLRLDLEAAIAAGNTDLQKVLECAQDNAAISAQHLKNSVEPVTVILELAKPMMEIAGVPAIEIPALGEESDLEAMAEVVKTLQGVVGTLQIAVDVLGGCPS